MRWCTYLSPDGPRAGLVADGLVHGLAEPPDLIGLIASDAAMREAGQRALREPAEVVPLAHARLTAPIPVPPSIRDFMAFEEHVVTSYRAVGLPVHPVWYELPVFYFTNPAAVHGPYEDVAISPGSVRLRLRA